MKIITYNLNGIRSAVSKGLLDWLTSENPDIVCFQETKAHLEDIPASLFEDLGYYTYWFSAQKKGYSGVGMLSKIKPLQHTIGNGYQQSDAEGRVLGLEFKKFYILSTYFPSGSSGEERQAYKFQWLDEFSTYVAALQHKSDKPIIVCGDYNICHYPIDIHDPIRNARSSGFLPEERQWMTDFFTNYNMIDSFRHIHPNVKDAYTWWSFRANARANNKGWRIDYIALSLSLKEHITDAGILPNVKHSDHCPTWVALDLH